MKFSSIVVSGFVFGSSMALEARLQLAFDETPCLADHLSQVDVGELCTGGRVRNALAKLYRQHVATTCEWDLSYEINLITRTLSNAKSISVLQSLCDVAEASVWASAPTTTWTDIDAQFTPDFMDEYTEGGTFLNEETGNFRNRDGTNPMDNRFYPTDEASYLAGEKIDAFYNDGATTSVLGAIDHLDQCNNQAIMCCFGRDRQYRDGNGDCAPRDCDDANPGDNSNLCYVDGDTPTAYPEDEEIHCHGLAWSSDMSDATNRLRFNTFFYVLMHDHMYSRGYVSPAVPEASMCGCIEDMNPVSRADCSEADMEVNYYFSYDVVSGAVIVEPEDLEFRFRACQGLTPDPDNVGEMVREDNDLASFAYRLVEDGKMSEETRDNIFGVLVGHDEPNNNTNEEACASAWNDATGGAPYTTRRELRRLK